MHKQQGSSVYRRCVIELTIEELEGDVGHKGVSVPMWHDVNVVSYPTRQVEKLYHRTAFLETAP